MAVVSIEPLEDERESTIDRFWKRTYKLSFRVITDDKFDGPYLVRSSVPYGIGSYYSTTTEHDYGAFCQSITAKQEKTGDGKSWIVSLDFGPYDANQNPADPTLGVPKVDWSWAQFEEIADKDADGNAILNSAGMLFDPPVMRDRSRPVLKIVRNERQFNKFLASAFKDKLNQDYFWDYEPGTVKVANISATWLNNPDIGWYWEVTYEFNMDEDGWNKPVLDAGTYERDTDGELVAINHKGVPASEPQLLDGSGHKLPEGGTPNYLDCKTYQLVDFSVFNLDTLYNETENPTPPPFTGGGGMGSA